METYNNCDEAAMPVMVFWEGKVEVSRITLQ